ncbi:MAG: CdaR family protein [Gemmatimonadota bacterium]|nr:CdaR family protein [Gemmatimonadota bacterium]
MSLHSLFTEKWPYKVAAIVLSVLLWLNVTADQPTQDQAIATRLEFEVRDTAWAILDAPEEVTTIFQGRSGDIIALLNVPVIRTVIDAVQDSVVEVQLDVNDVEFDRSLNARATAVTPPRVTVRLEPRRSVMVPVIPLADTSAAEGFAIYRLTARPESVRLIGPASVVDPVMGVATERVELQDARESRTRLVDLIPPEAAGTLTVTPMQVSLSVDVDSVIVRRFQVRVAVLGDGAGQVDVDPPVVRVEVRGAARAVQALTPTDLEASVRVAGVPSAPRTAPILIAVPSDTRVTAVSDPASVTIRPRGTGTEDGPPS